MKPRVIVILFTLLAVASTASAEVYTCTPVNVASFSERVHVECSEGTPLDEDIVFFAVPTTDQNAAKRFLDLGTAAVAHGKTITIVYAPLDTSGPNYGCALSNCLPALAILLNHE